MKRPIKNIIIKYKQYLKLRKIALTNTVEAYLLTDLDKLFAFLEREAFILLVTWKFGTFQPDYATSAFTRVHKLAFCLGYALFPLFCWRRPHTARPSNYWNRHKSANTCLTYWRWRDWHLIGSIDRSHGKDSGTGYFETLYSCGLRYPNYNLKLSDLYLKEKFIKVEGKKQTTPGPHLTCHSNWNCTFQDRNEGLIKPGYEDFVFISRSRENISRIMVFDIIKELASKLGWRKPSAPILSAILFATHLLEERQPASHTNVCWAMKDMESHTLAK